MALVFLIPLLIFLFFFLSIGEWLMVNREWNVQCSVQMIKCFKFQKANYSGKTSIDCLHWTMMIENQIICKWKNIVWRARQIKGKEKSDTKQIIAENIHLNIWLHKNSFVSYVFFAIIWFDRAKPTQISRNKVQTRIEN